MSERTEESLRARVRETPLIERLNESRKRIAAMCSERRGPRMTIPVQHYDDDFFICTTLEDARDEVARLRACLINMQAAWNNKGETTSVYVWNERMKAAMADVEAALQKGRA